MPDSHTMLSSKRREIKVTLLTDTPLTFANLLQIKLTSHLLCQHFCLMSNTDVEFILTSSGFGHVGSEGHMICCTWSPLFIPELKKKKKTSIFPQCFVFSAGSSLVAGIKNKSIKIVQLLLLLLVVVIVVLVFLQLRITRDCCKFSGISYVLYHSVHSCIVSEIMSVSYFAQGALGLRLLQPFKFCRWLQSKKIKKLLWIKRQCCCSSYLRGS